MSWHPPSPPAFDTLLSCPVLSCSDSPAAFPAVPASPIPSPHESSDADLMPPPVSVSPRPAASTSPSPSSLTASPSPASTGNPQVRYGTKWCNFGRCKMVQVIALFLVFCCCTRSLGTPSKEVMAQVSYMSKLLS